MRCRHRLLRLTQLTLTLIVGSLSTIVGLAQGPASPDRETPPRPGLTAQQTKQAVQLATAAMRELRTKAEAGVRVDSDPREYVVNVEMLAARPPRKAPGTAKAPVKATESAAGKPPLAVVTTYRYFDDSTVFATVDLATGKVVAVQQAKHIHTALSDSEFEDAKTLAQNRSEEVRKLYDRYGDQLDVYPQFSQFRAKDEDRLHRVIHLNYRLGTRDLSYPRPMVDMTTRQVTVPAPEPTPRTPARRP